MNAFKTLWDFHKWTGLTIGLALAVTAVTGFLLLVKKDFSSIQPPTQVGAEGSVEEFLSIAEVFAVVHASGNPAFATLDDIDRVDFRPGKRVHKVRSKHGYEEIQVCAVTGAILSETWRPSDLIESIHDGSWFAGLWHDYGMPVVAIGLLFLTFSGFYIWVVPVLRRRRRSRTRLAKNQAPAAPTVESRDA